MHSNSSLLRKPKALTRAHFSPLKSRGYSLRHQGLIKGTGPAGLTADLGGFNPTTPPLQQWWNPHLVEQLRPLTRFHD